MAKEPKPTPSDPLEQEIQRSIRLPEGVWRRIRAAAALEGKSANEWMAEQLKKLITPSDEKQERLGYATGGSPAMAIRDRPA